MNLLDRVISWISPSSGLRRERARMAARSLRTYDAAATDRRGIAWTAGNTSADSEIQRSLPALRNRSREQIRNNPYAARAASAWTAALIGTGITAKLSSGQTLWEQWLKECDDDGLLDFYGLQALVCRTVFESGEAIIRLRWTTPDEGMAIPLRIRVLEPDHLDSLKTSELSGGRYIDSGIEFDASGRRVAYWLFDQHPGSMIPISRSLQSRRVDAQDVIHVFERLRPGQNRGVPRLSPSLLKLRDIADYEESELLRKGIESCFAAFVTSDGAGTYAGTGPIKSTDRDVASTIPLEGISSGTIKYLSPGESITFGSPSPATGYNEFLTQQLHSLATGIGITYQMLTGDLSRANYSSMRGGKLEFRRVAEQYQWHTLIPQFCDAVASSWRKAAIIGGAGRAGRAAFEWTPPKWDFVDPLKDASGVILELAAGLTSWEEEARRRGWTPEKLLDEIKANQEAFKTAGITIQWDQLLLGAMASQNQMTSNMDTSANA